VASHGSGDFSVEAMDPAVNDAEGCGVSKRYAPSGLDARSSILITARLTVREAVEGEQILCGSDGEVDGALVSGVGAWDYMGMAARNYRTLVGVGKLTCLTLCLS